MRINSSPDRRIGIGKKEGLNYLEFHFFEELEFLRHGLILGYENGKKIKAGDIPGLLSIVSDIPQKDFKVIVPKQIHQTGVEIFSKEKLTEEDAFSGEVIRPEADALLTNRDNLFLVIQIADCLPVFLVDPSSEVIGLAHIGWRGALLGMAENFIDNAIKNFNCNPEDVKLVFGPAIGKCCYHISDSLAILINNKYIKENGTDKYLDLNGYVKDRFLKTGVRDKNIFISGECTCCGNKLYQSYRRERDKAGRMIAFMGKVKNN